jgi:hypothetical protein
VLADHREQVTEQRPLVDGQRLGDLVERGGGPVRGLVGTDPGVTASIDPGAAVGLRYLCLPSLRNRRPSSARSR